MARLTNQPYMAYSTRDTPLAGTEKNTYRRSTNCQLPNKCEDGTERKQPTGWRTPESSPRGMFQRLGPYVRMKISPPTRLCPDFGADLRSDPIGVRMVTHTSKKAKKPKFPKFCYKWIVFACRGCIAWKIPAMDYENTIPMAWCRNLQ